MAKLNEEHQIEALNTAQRLQEAAMAAFRTLEPTRGEWAVMHVESPRLIVGGYRGGVFRRMLSRRPLGLDMNHAIQEARERGIGNPVEQEASGYSILVFGLDEAGNTQIADAIRSSL